MFYRSFCRCNALGMSSKHRMHPHGKLCFSITPQSVEMKSWVQWEQSWRSSGAASKKTTDNFTDRIECASRFLLMHESSKCWTMKRHYKLFSSGDRGCSGFL